jgi:hypothetical protein
MSESREWDFPATKRYHRRPRVEIMEPPGSIRARFDIMVTRHRRPSWIIPAALIAVLRDMAPRSSSGR